jgi:hypothetical protein
MMSTTLTLHSNLHISQKRRRRRGATLTHMTYIHIPVPYDCNWLPRLAFAESKRVESRHPRSRYPHLAYNVNHDATGTLATKGTMC